VEHDAWWIATDVSEEPDVTVFRVEELSKSGRKLYAYSAREERGIEERSVRRRKLRISGTQKDRFSEAK
jgi:hypothetical protein